MDLTYSPNEADVRFETFGSNLKSSGAKVFDYQDNKLSEDASTAFENPKTTN